MLSHTNVGSTKHVIESSDGIVYIASIRLPSGSTMDDYEFANTHHTCSGHWWLDHREPSATRDCHEAPPMGDKTQ